MMMILAVDEAAACWSCSASARGSRSRVVLRDVTVGIVGLGSIGRAVGALATAFGCRVIATRRRPEAAAQSEGDASADEPSFGEAMLDRVGGPETLPALLAESDFVVLAAPLTPRPRI